MKPIQIYRVKDAKEKHYKNKGMLFDLPMKLLLCGKSQYSGKSSIILNYFCQNDERLYKNDFEEIYIFSGSASTDNKIKTLIAQLDIPEENIHSEFNEDMLEAIYDLTEEEYEESIENGESPKHVLLILDDISFNGDLKKKNNGILNKVFCNGRHINLSIIVTSQKYSQLHTCQRENATGVICWSCTDKQLELIADDHNILDSKKQFKKMFRTVTEKPYTALVINYSNPKDDRYMNINFEPIGECGKVKGKECDCK